MKNIKNLMIFFVLSLCLSCNEDESSDNSFSVPNLISSQVEQQILPAVNNFVDASSALNAAVTSYTNETTENNLLVARNEWKNTVAAYENVYTFNIGEVRENFLHLIIYPWPITTEAIENIIIENAEINQEVIDNLSPRAKTFAALEYLLFKRDLVSTNTEFLTSSKRLTYLQFTADYISSLSLRMHDVWSPEGNNYASRLISNRETGIDGSFNLFFNGIYNAIDTGKVTKIGKPAGLENSSVTNAELTQAHFSNNSLSLLKSSITSIENAYFNEDGIGIDDYVLSLTKTDDLNNAVEEKINAVYTAIDAITTNLVTAIDNEPQLVSTLHSKLDDLRIVFGVDMRSILSIVITSTDNDGD